MAQSITTQINPEIIQPSVLIEEAEQSLLARTMPEELFKLVVAYTGDPAMPGCDAPLTQKQLVREWGLGGQLQNLFQRNCFAFPIARRFAVVADEGAQDVNLAGYMKMARFYWEELEEYERNSVYWDLFFHSPWRAPISVAKAFVGWSSDHWLNLGSYHEDLSHTVLAISEKLRLDHRHAVGQIQGYLLTTPPRERPAAIGPWLEQHREPLAEISELRLDQQVERFLPTEVETLENLEELTVNFQSRVGKGILLADLNRFQALRELTLRNCALRRYDFSSLVMLRDLTLTNCRLSEVPPFIQGLNKLENLDLSENQIGELPDFLGALPHLKCLYLGDNNIRQVPDSLGRFPLRRLWLQGNPLTTLPPSLMGKTYVQVDPNVVKDVGGCCTIL